MTDGKLFVVWSVVTVVWRSLICDWSDHNVYIINIFTSGSSWLLCASGSQSQTLNIILTLGEPLQRCYNIIIKGGCVCMTLTMLLQQGNHSVCEESCTIFINHYLWAKHWAKKLRHSSSQHLTTSDSSSTLSCVCQSSSHWSNNKQNG